MQHSIDLSSFPLLRIDQIPHHETRTLVESEAMLSELEREGEVESITPFLSKLLSHVRKEIACRSGEEAKQILAKQAEDYILPSARVISPKSKIKQTQSATRRATSPSPSFVVFSSPNLKSSSFRLRAKQAKVSLQARSNEAVSIRRRQEQHDRTRQALDTMRTWRTKRDVARQLREERLNEERRLRIERWNARIEREKQIHALMQAAAEDAKSRALESGCTSEEALVEAAAAASRVVDDESTTFQCVDTRSDDGSFIYDDCIYEENPPCVLPSSAIESNTTAKKNVLADADLRTKSLGSEEVTSLTLQSVNSAQNTNIDDVENTTSNLLPAGTEYEACPSDTSLCHSKESHDSDAISTRSEINETLSAAFNANQDETLCYENAEEHSISVDTHVISTKQIELKMKPTVFFSPRNETDQVQSATVDEINFRTDMKSTESIPRERRYSCDFPSLSSIFAHNGGRQKESNTADEKQREQSRLFQYHIDQYSKMRAFFAAKIEDATCHSSDDSSDCCDDSFVQGLFYRIHSHRPEVMSIIRTAFSNRQLSAWNELPSDVEGNVWNLLWVWGLPNASIFDNLLIFQKVNRFRGTRGLTRKDLLKKNIQRFCNSASTTKDEDSFNFMPLTYALPHEFSSFVSCYQSIQKSLVDTSSNYWIIKPVGLSRGRGISIVNDITDVSYSRPVVVQRYITNPLCFMGFKFDLRMYILVTSFSPLEAFIYKEGLARFGSKQYSLSPELLHDRRIHLTNSSVQQEYSEEIDRSHPAYLAGANGFESKVAFSWLWRRLEAHGVDTNDLWAKLTDVCRNTLVAAGSDIQCQLNSFEIFGYDLMFDQNLKCWLIEVNSSPSLACESPLDSRVKGSLIRDTIDLVNPPAYDREVLSAICKRRLTHRLSAAKSICDTDVEQMLMHKALRGFGEVPTRMGNYERLVPTPGTPHTNHI